MNVLHLLPPLPFSLSRGVGWEPAKCVSSEHAETVWWLIYTRGSGCNRHTSLSLLLY